MLPPAGSESGRIKELVQYFLRLGLLGFGGPVALVGQMERELVGERKWLTKEQMREDIAICPSLPGPLGRALCLSRRSPAGDRRFLRREPRRHRADCAFLLPLGQAWNGGLA